MRLFGLTAIKKAAYRYINAFSADITLNDNQVQCVLQFSGSPDEIVLSQLIEDFKKEILDQQLREEIKAETAAFRDLIFAHAFSKTGLVKDEPIPEN